MIRRQIVFALIVISSFLGCKSNMEKPVDNSTPVKKKNTLFIGTYTNNTPSHGIYMYEFDESNGLLKCLDSIHVKDNPSYLSIHQNKKWIYAVHETAADNFGNSGYISGFAIDSTNWKLKFLNSVSSKGQYPCHISIDKTGKHCFVANYGGGNIAMPAINGDGFLSDAISVINHKGKGPHANQESPHAHMIVQNSNNGFIYSTNLGTDTVYTYKLSDNKHGLLETGNNLGLSPGTGPRHLSFHPTKPWAYILGELNGVITACTIEKNGKLIPFDSISNLIGFENETPHCADIHISSDGRFLYASNRGNANNIALYTINQKNGKLSFIEHTNCGGDSPRSFTLSPSNNFLLVANQNSNNVVVFKRDSKTGKLNSTDIGINVPSPVCLKFY